MKFEVNDKISELLSHIKKVYQMEHKMENLDTEYI